MGSCCTACNRKDTACDCCLYNIVCYSTTRSLKMTWMDCLTDEINPKISPPPRILWIRRIWLDLRAFFLGLISVMTDFPSNIELGSPWGTPVPWKRICWAEWWWWEPFDTCVLLQWEGMHNACGFNQTSSARLYWGVIWCVTRALFLSGMVYQIPGGPASSSVHT